MRSPPLTTPMADREGISVFCRGDNGATHHTYSTCARGLHLLNTAYNYLDLVPRGRDEDGLDSAMEWVRHHDRYDDRATRSGAWRVGPAPTTPSAGPVALMSPEG